MTLCQEDLISFATKQNSLNKRRKRLKRVHRAQKLLKCHFLSLLEYEKDEHYLKLLVQSGKSVKTSSGWQKWGKEEDDDNEEKECNKNNKTVIWSLSRTDDI